MYRRRKGSVMVTVLLIFILIVALAFVIYQNSMSNLREAKHQEQKLEAYYLARSGLEIGLSALFVEDSTTSETLFSQFPTTIKEPALLNESNTTDTTKAITDPNKSFLKKRRIHLD